MKLLKENDGGFVKTVNMSGRKFNKICLLHVVLVCKLNDNTVNKGFKYQCTVA